MGAGRLRPGSLGAVGLRTGRLRVVGLRAGRLRVVGLRAGRMSVVSPLPGSLRVDRLPAGRLRVTRLRPGSLLAVGLGSGSAGAVVMRPGGGLSWIRLPGERRASGRRAGRRTSAIPTWCAIPARCAVSVRCAVSGAHAGVGSRRAGAVDSPAVHSPAVHSPAWDRVPRWGSTTWPGVGAPFGVGTRPGVGLLTPAPPPGKLSHGKDRKHAKAEWHPGSGQNRSALGIKPPIPGTDDQLAALGARDRCLWLVPWRLKGRAMAHAARVSCPGPRWRHPWRGFPGRAGARALRGGTWRRGEAGGYETGKFHDLSHRLPQPQHVSTKTFSITKIFGAYDTKNLRDHELLPVRYPAGVCGTR